jgi:DNA polymerase-3 subunit gamma/tau
VSAYAERITPELVQLAYQICVQGRADLALAPDETVGFSMTLLRLLAFEPAGADPSSPGDAGERPTRAPAHRSDAPSTPRPARAEVSAPVRPAAAAVAAAATPVVAPVAAARSTPAAAPKAAPQATPTEGKAPAVELPTDPAAWPAFVAGLKLSAMAAQIAAQTELKAVNGNAITLALPATHKHLADRTYSDKLKAALEQATGRKLLLAFEVGAVADASLAAQEKRERADQKAKTEATFRDEPFVQDMLTRFDAKIRPDSIKPVS